MTGFFKSVVNSLQEQIYGVFIFLLVLLCGDSAAFQIILEAYKWKEICKTFHRLKNNSI